MTKPNAVVSCNAKTVTVVYEQFHVSTYCFGGHYIFGHYCDYKGNWCDHSLSEGDPPASMGLDKSSAKAKISHVRTRSEDLLRNKALLYQSGHPQWYLNEF